MKNNKNSYCKNRIKGFFVKQIKNSRSWNKEGDEKNNIQETDEILKDNNRDCQNPEEKDDQS